MYKITLAQRKWY